MPLTRTLIGDTVPAGPDGLGKVSDVPAGDDTDLAGRHGDGPHRDLCGPGHEALTGEGDRRLRRQDRARGRVDEGRHAERGQVRRPPGPGTGPGPVARPEVSSPRSAPAARPGSPSSRRPPSPRCRSPPRTPISARSARAGQVGAHQPDLLAGGDRRRRLGERDDAGRSDGSLPAGRCRRGPRPRGPAGSGSTMKFATAFRGQAAAACPDR